MRGAIAEMDEQLLEATQGIAFRRALLAARQGGKSQLRSEVLRAVVQAFFFDREVGKVVLNEALRHFWGQIIHANLRASNVYFERMRHDPSWKRVSAQIEREFMRK